MLPTGLPAVELPERQPVGRGACKAADLEYPPRQLWCALRRYGAAGAWEERKLRPQVFVVSDVVGVAADPQAARRGQQRERAGPARVTTRVPGERQAARRV